MERRTQGQELNRRPARRRWVGMGLSVAAHGTVLALLVGAVVSPPQPLEQAPPPTVELVPGPPAPTPSPTPSPEKPTPAKATAAPAPARTATVKRATPPKSTRPAPAPPEPDEGDPGPSYAPVLSGADLAGAASADSGGGGGACDMIRRLQAALGKDPLVLRAVAQARLAPGTEGKPLVVWNGDWVQSGAEEGKGLSAVREAILWEVGFAPKACRAEPVRGFVLLSLRPGVRLALGAGQWRWSDLLASRATPEG